jgi:Gas vesicle synthesis protein GvpL/GvpF
VSYEADLRRALAALAAEDVEAILEEARAGAWARARELIEDALVAEILAAAAAEGMPRPPLASEAPRISADPGPRDGSVLWAYCVLAAGDAGSLPTIVEGIEPGSAVEAVADGDLAVLVSEAPLSDYGDDRLREHLNDIDWVERTARAHEAVLDRALSACTIVPLRLCTLFRDRDGVRAMLRQERKTLLAGLETLAGRAEWGLKLFLDPSRLEASESEHDDEPDGAAYLARKQRERDARSAARDSASRYAADAHDRLAGVADAARANPVQRPEAHGHAGEMLLNGVYLVRLEREAELMRLVEELRDEWAADGVELELTGPWPGYNFASGAETVTP